MQTLNIVLGDLNYFNKHTINDNFTPLGCGYIATYLKKLYGRDITISIFKDPLQLLEYVKTNHVHFIGLSLYFWNHSMNHVVISKLRRLHGRKVQIILGGPSIDTIEEEQKKILQQFSEINAIVENEGELGFSNIIKEFLSGSNRLWEYPIDGVTFIQGKDLVNGNPIGLTIDLGTLGSPYLEGLMDTFIEGPFRPLVQTSRGCPYTCKFCVSGKNNCKPRKFPIEQVKEEITFVTKKFVNRLHFTLYIADENFGIFPRDVDIAMHIKENSTNLGYPSNVYFYNDKRFTNHSKKVIEILGDINNIGLTISLQSENKEALKAIKRKNLSSEEIDTAIAWASKRNIQITTEAIFGLPYETLDSFTGLLERSVQRGFDSILCYNLFIMDGIELNRDSYRKKYSLLTKYRLVGSNYGIIKGEFCCESEEVVVSTRHFSFEDFKTIRELNFMFYNIYSLDLYKWFFNAFVNFNLPLVRFLTQFMNPNKKHKWPVEYLKFLEDFKTAYLSELCTSKEDLEHKMRAIYEKNNKEVDVPLKLNVFFGARLIYFEKWLPEVLKTHLQTFDVDIEQQLIFEEALSLCQKERINLRNIEENQNHYLTVNYDFISWKKEKYLTTIKNKRMKSKRLLFTVVPYAKKAILSFREECGHFNSLDFYYLAVDTLVPRSSKLLYGLSYD